MQELEQRMKGRTCEGWRVGFLHASSTLDIFEQLCTAESRVLETTRQEWLGWIASGEKPRTIFKVCSAAY